MSDLDRLFYWRGIAAEFCNYRGETVHLPLENRLALLTAMGVDVDSPDKVSQAAFSLDVAPWLNWFPEFVLSKEGEGGGFYINLHPDDLDKTFTWKLIDEDREPRQGLLQPSTLREVGDYLYQGTRYTRRFYSIPNLKMGYYRLSVSCGEQSRSTTLAVIPQSAYLPEVFRMEKRSWGVIIQLYTLRTESDWGIGDFGSLRKLATALAELGADMIGLNPLHALSPDIKHSFSPYSPSDRRFLCTLYIDPMREPEFKTCVAEEGADQTTARTQEIEALRSTANVDYARVSDLKYQVFERMYDCFYRENIENRTDRGQRFLDYCVLSGDVLKIYSLYEGANKRWVNNRHIILISRAELEQAFADNGASDLIEQHQETILFHSYLQWIAHCQLGELQNFTKSQGMALGLIRDLAVGADGSGSEVSSNPNLFCRNASVGAPPDPLAEQGQNWGIPPIDPANLRQSGFEHFINLLRENMSLCGALRIDHAMSLMRLWWCPPGKTADHGAYVYYPFEEMLGILVLESQRNKCLIIGEDLGVVPDEFREAMAKNHIFSNKVFYFEKSAHDRFRPPGEYAARALAMINNHDVPTLLSWWSGSDLELRDKLNIFEEGVTYAQALQQRIAEKGQVLDLLNEGGNLPLGWQCEDTQKDVDKALVESVLKHGAKVNSQIFAIQLEDLIMMDAPVNVPGTFKEYPNWQRKISKTISEIFASEETKNLLTEINSIRSNLS
ncbi:MAG: 4-alpha-glucanotransferase [Cellvibrionaceae bacterium]|nr:4-alpha-glucanotransferase [Cellvibrionaceae bacterium]